MNIFAFLSWYLNANIIFGLAFFISLFVSRPLSARAQLRINYSLLIFTTLMCFLAPLLPSPGFHNPTVKVYNEYYTAATPLNLTNTPDGRINVSSPLGNQPININLWGHLLLSLFLFVLLKNLIIIVSEVKNLRVLTKQSFLLRKFKSTSIYLSESVTVPFSFWQPQSTCVIVPASLLDKPQFMKLAILHEMQHHRQRDTLWVYILWGLKTFLFLNPLIFIWNQKINEVQELSCDESLLKNKGLDFQDYSRCLLEVAQMALAAKGYTVRATGVALFKEHGFLTRRIKKMQKLNGLSSKKWLLTMTAIGVILVGGLTAAARGFVQDRRITQEQAMAMAKNVRQSSDFPVVINDSVLAELNRFLGTLEGRKFIKDSLRRLDGYRPQIETQIKQYQAPIELLAVPLVESGYQNLPQAENKSWGAGLWMFIEPTARAYGLQVSAVKDERLDVELETDAAMRYLIANHLRFDDWLLALLAYNSGEREVQNLINKTGSRDAWVLIRNGLKGDKNYLARVIAAVLIIKNPELIKL